MKIDIGKELQKDSYDSIDVYTKYNDKKIIFIDTETLRKYEYATANITRNVNPMQYGLTDRYFGGNIFKCAILKDSPYILLVNRFNVTLGVMLPRENMRQLSVKELYELAKKLNIPVENDLKKDDIIDIINS